MRSVLENPEPVQEYLEEEIMAVGVVQITGTNGVTIHTSKFGEIPKGNQAGMWRFILDLPSPAGTRVNDGRRFALCDTPL